ncbi:alpha-amylase family glycosyl hydrolase [Mycoplasmopsis cricetuli]|uniref:alpha-amylase family glycosyl hydrolase n=1 Tax=Mycoplasmopsis cricetuli TaxID=171283 RepID=UPI00046F2B1A|nr:alpha-amylase family glycosyl hydrolase [Mycoplasmopsis cricetuli]
MKTIKLEERIIYQIFPRSFMDSNNDGDGDLNGITSKLLYLKDLGINTIWLCPIYKTNFVDAGYDVLDYKNVWKQFGTLEDFKELTSKAKELNIDIVMDIVLNHVSNEHEWFKKACQSAKNIEHNYFIWKENLTDQEKQVQSIFGGSAWEFVPSVNKYYFHLFAKEQVDLNWAHPDTLNAMVDVINFWYNLGVKGFRLDAIKHVSKNFHELKNNPVFSWCQGSVEYLKKFNELAFKDKNDAFTLGEASGISLEELIKYRIKNKVADNYFNFAWWWIGWGTKTGRNGYDANWDYKQFVYQQQPFQKSELIKPQMITNFLSNHDTSRSISRWGDEGIFHDQAAKTQALLLFSLKGIPCIYYGEEIGMLNTHFNSRSEFRDIDSLNSFINMVDKEKIYSEEELLIYSNINSRDAGRTIMQWDNSINSGFNKGAKSWIKLGRMKQKINVQIQKQNKNSVWHFYKKLITFRTKTYHDVLIYGSSNIELLSSGIIQITRKFNDKTILVYINITNKELDFNQKIKNIILSSWNDKKISNKFLRPYESIMILK